MIYLILILAWLFSSACSLPPASSSLLVRQDDGLVDNYPCSFCELDDPENIGDDTCSNIRHDEDFCIVYNPPDSTNGNEVSITIVQTKPTGSWVVDGDAKQVDFETYPSCGSALSKPVSKFWAFPLLTDLSKCSLEVRQLKENDINTGNFQTDHVYENQLLLDFFKWLHGDLDLVGWPKGYERPSTDWILGTLLGNQDWPDVKPFEFAGNSLWFNLAGQMGGYLHITRLALVDSKINGHKGKFFGDDQPATFPAKKTAIADVKPWQRGIAGVFQYMKQDAVWKIFTSTSKALEDIFGLFDVEYDWEDEGALGRPERKEGEGPAGLRDLYCYWIDERLAVLERRAGEWLVSAKADFDKNVVTNPNNVFEKSEWLKQFDNGIFAADKFKFPQVDPEKDDKGVIKKSRYDMWDNGAAGPWVIE